MISLSDDQLQTVMTTASALEPEKRDTYLRRVAALLMPYHRPTDDDVADAAAKALRSLRVVTTAA
jgi:hypothetical protein